MDLNQLSPYIRVAWDDTIYPPVSIKERALFDYELLYVKSGEIRVKIENQTYHGIPGDIFLFKPRQHHSIDLLNNKPLRQPHIHFDLIYKTDSPMIKTSFNPIRAMTDQESSLFREDITAQMPNPLPNHIRVQKPIVLEKLIFNIIHEHENKHPYYETTAKGLFLQLWAQLMREHHWSSNAALMTNWIQLDRVKTYLSHNSDKEVTLDELSKVANLSKYYFCRLFKTAFGVGPIQYHLMIRLENAKRMIQFTDIPIKEIASQLGFQSIHSFSRSFRIMEGVPPSYYRNRG